MIALAGAMPPAVGRKVKRGWNSPDMCWLSLITYSPSAVGVIRQAVRPRSRVGFQESGTPLSTSRAAMPRRSTPPGPMRSPPDGTALLCQRWWPATYMAAPVIATELSESPPV